MREGHGEIPVGVASLDIVVSISGSAEELRAQQVEVYKRLSDVAGVRLESWHVDEDGIMHPIVEPVKNVVDVTKVELSPLELQSRLDTDIRSVFTRNDVTRDTATRIVNSLTNKNRVEGTLREIILIGRDRVRAMGGIGVSCIVAIEKCLRAELGGEVLWDGTPEIAAMWSDRTNQVPAIVLEGRPNYGRFQLGAYTIDQILKGSVEEVAEFLPKIWEWEGGVATGKKLDTNQAVIYKKRADGFMSRFNVAKHIQRTTA